MSDGQVYAEPAVGAPVFDHRITGSPTIPLAPADETSPIGESNLSERKLDFLHGPDEFWLICERHGLFRYLSIDRGSTETSSTHLEDTAECSAQILS